MKTFFRILARTLAALFAILFALSLPMILLVVNVERQLLDSEIYKQALDREEIYKNLPAMIGQTLASGASVNPCEANPIACGIDNPDPELHACLEKALGQDAYLELAQNKRVPTEIENTQTRPCFDQFGWPEIPEGGGPPDYINNLSPSDWEVIVRSLLPPEDMQQMAEQTLDGLFAYLNGDVESATIPLKPLKARLAGAEGVTIVETLIKAQPPCTLDQLAIMTATLVWSGELIFCNPGDDMILMLQPLFQDQLVQVSATLPDEAVLIKPSPITEGDPRQGVQIARTIMRLSLIIPLVLLLGITIFAVRDRPSWLRWWGVPLLAAGTLSLLASLALPSLYGFFINRYVIPDVPAHIPIEFAQMGFDVGRAVLSSMSLRLALISGIIGLVAGGMLVFSFIGAAKSQIQEG